MGNEIKRNITFFKKAVSGWQDFFINSKFLLCFAEVSSYASNCIPGNVIREKSKPICDKCTVLMMTSESFNQPLSFKIKLKSHRWLRTQGQFYPYLLFVTAWVAINPPWVGSKKRGCLILLPRVHLHETCLRLHNISLQQGGENPSQKCIHL